MDPINNIQYVNLSGYNWAMRLPDQYFTAINILEQVSIMFRSDMKICILTIDWNGYNLRKNICLDHYVELANTISDTWFSYINDRGQLEFSRVW